MFSICTISPEFIELSKVHGGRSPNVYHFSKEEVNLGAEVHLICPRKNNRSPLEEVIEGIHIYRVDPPFRLRVLKKYKELQKENSFDIINIQAVTYKALPLALSKDFLCNSPLVVHVPHVRIADERAYFDYPQEWFSYPLWYRANRFFHYFTFLIKEKFMLKKADGIITPSKASYRDLMSFYRLSTTKVKIVPNGVDIDRFFPQDPKELRNELGIENKKIILYVGHFGFRKGLPYLLRALSSVVKTCPDVILLLIGGTPKGAINQIFWNILKTLAKKWAVEKHVKMLDAIPHTQLPAYYSMADIFAFPTLYEGLPKAPLEAMACGTPVVGFNISSMPELFENRKEGLLVPAKNPKKLAEAIVQLLENRSLAKRMGENAKERVKREFNWHVVAKKILIQYKKFSEVTLKKKENK